MSSFFWDKILAEGIALEAEAMQMVRIFLMSTGVKNFPLKNLTNHRLFDFVLGMIAKIINKKVGCALIVSSVLAASSVQGSSTLHGKSRFTRQDGERIRYTNVRTNRESCWKVFFLEGYHIVAGSKISNGREELIIALVQDDRKVSIEKLAERGFPGLESCTYGSITAYVPKEFMPALMPDGETITLLPYPGWPHGLSSEGRLVMFLEDESKVEIVGIPADETSADR
jgi:hypothetical protein